MLKKIGHLDSTRVTPFDNSIKLYENKGRSIAQLEYSRVIGCLIYVMTSTGPDIAFEVSKLSRFTSRPGNEH